MPSEGPRNTSTPGPLSCPGARVSLMVGPSTSMPIGPRSRRNRKDLGSRPGLAIVSDLFHRSSFPPPTLIPSFRLLPWIPQGMEPIQLKLHSPLGSCGPLPILPS